MFFCDSTCCSSCVTGWTSISCHRLAASFAMREPRFRRDPISWQTGMPRIVAFGLRSWVGCTEPIALLHGHKNMRCCACGLQLLAWHPEKFKKDVVADTCFRSMRKTVEISLQSAHIDESDIISPWSCWCRILIVLWSGYWSVYICRLSEVEHTKHKARISRVLEEDQLGTLLVLDHNVVRR